MKKIVLIILLVVAAFIGKAQTALALADQAFNKQDYPKAYELYNQALTTEPKNIVALRRAGYSLMNCKGQELNATQYFTKALAIEPKDAVSNYYLGVIFMDAAKQASNKTTKSDFKAKAATHLKNAAMYGSKEANAAISELNAI